MLPWLSSIKMSNAGGLTDREAAIDAVIRFVNSLDEGNSVLCESSVTDDMIMDLMALGESGRILEGQKTVVEALMAALKPLDTTHMVTNIRCMVKGNEAEFTSTTLAQHFRGGQGTTRDDKDNWLMGNLYKATIVRDGDVWKIKKLILTPAWTQGNYGVMKV